MLRLRFNGFPPLDVGHHPAHGAMTQLTLCNGAGCHLAGNRKSSLKGLDNAFFPFPNFFLSSSMKRPTIDSKQLMRRAEDLITAASNRYRITVQVATRAQRRRYEDFDREDDPKMKPVIRAVIEMSDELTQPEIIGD